MNETILTDYSAALDRLAKGKPLRVPKGTRITNDAVALEAGRGKGTIKKSRPVFAALIAAISEAATEQATGGNQRQLEKAKEDARRYRVELEAAVARELSLLHELYAVKRELSALTGANVLPLRGSTVGR